MSPEAISISTSSTLQAPAGDRRSSDDVFPPPSPVSLRLRRVLQVVMALLGALGTSLLGMGQGSFWLIGLACGCSLVSLLLVDLWQKFVLPVWLTNVLLVAAFLATVFEVLRYPGPIQVLLVANLLVYIQCILQFQNKQLSFYLYLLILSVFQVVSACAFFHGLLFGFLLTVYLVLALLALVLLAYYAEWSDVNCHIGLNLTGGPSVPLRSPAFCGDGPDGRWRLGFNHGMFWRLAGLCLVSVLFAGVLFLTVPRMSARPWQGLSPSAIRTIGFDRALRLGELGRLTEDPTPVMRVELMNLDYQPIGYVGPVYLRGGSFQVYYENHWAMNIFAVRNRYYTLEPLFRGPGQPITLQRIILERTERPEVFAIWPFGKWDDSNLVYDEDRTTLLRVTGQAQRTTFELTTSAVEDGRLVDIIPCSEPVDTTTYLILPWIVYQPDGWGGRFITHRQLFENRGWRQVVELAEKWASEAPSSREDHFRLAKHFEQQLALTGEYRYSLAGVARDPEVDPLVDFLTRHREGHCEYFASALAILLRCQGIPTRIVIGYRSDEFNTLGGFYQVRQQDAHAWVEAYLSPDKLSEELLDGKARELWQHGAWLRLDPTPPSATRNRLGNSFLQQLWITYTFLDHVWYKYVLQLDRTTQQAQVYQPVQRRVREESNRLLDRRFWVGLIEQLRSRLVDAFPAGRWLALAAMSAGAFILVILALRLYRDPLWRIWLFRRLPASRSVRPWAYSVAAQAYAELERLLTLWGYRRKAWECPARFVAESLSQVLTDGDFETNRRALFVESDGLVRSAQTIVATYYRARFGSEPLAEAQLHELASSLQLLRKALGRPKRR